MNNTRYKSSHNSRGDNISLTVEQKAEYRGSKYIFFSLWSLYFRVLKFVLIQRIFYYYDL